MKMILIFKKLSVSFAFDRKDITNFFQNFLCIIFLLISAIIFVSQRKWPLVPDTFLNVQTVIIKKSFEKKCENVEFIFPISE